MKIEFINESITENTDDCNLKRKFSGEITNKDLQMRPMAVMSKVEVLHLNPDTFGVFWGFFTTFNVETWHQVPSGMGDFTKFIFWKTFSLICLLDFKCTVKPPQIFAEICRLSFPISVSGFANTFGSQLSVSLLNFSRGMWWTLLIHCHYIFTVNFGSVAQTISWNKKLSKGGSVQSWEETGSLKKFFIIFWKRLRSLHCNGAQLLNFSVDTHCVGKITTKILCVRQLNLYTWVERELADQVGVEVLACTNIGYRSCTWVGTSIYVLR